MFCFLFLLFRRATFSSIFCLPRVASTCSYFHLCCQYQSTNWNRLVLMRTCYVLVQKNRFPWEAESRKYHTKTDGVTAPVTSSNSNGICIRVDHTFKISIFWLNIALNKIKSDLVQSENVNYEYSMYYLDFIQKKVLKFDFSSIVPRDIFPSVLLY